MVPRNILIPLARDHQTEPVLAYARPFAAALRARLTLLHVVESAPFRSWSDPLPLAAAGALCTSPGDETAAKIFLQEQLRSVRQSGVRCEAMLLTGPPFQMIIAVAQARHIDLIIMGSHGRTGLAHLVLGSVAEKVLRLAPCPVLVVRQPTCAAACATEKIHTAQ